jgi:hypothetical protein
MSDSPRTRTTERLANSMLALDCVDRIEADLPAAIKARGKIYQLDLTEVQLKALARIAAHVAGTHIAWALDSATGRILPPENIPPK